jgi:hypothetical protein
MMMMMMMMMMMVILLLLLLQLARDRVQCRDAGYLVSIKGREFLDQLLK